MMCIFQINIYEKHTISVRITFWIGSIFFLIFGFYLGENIIHYATGVTLALMFLVAPFTTGLSDTKIIYEANLTGLSRMAPKKMPYSNIEDFSIQKEKNDLILNITFQNQRKIKMTFNSESEENIENKFY